MQAYEKPVPVPDHVTGPFWEAAKQGRLLIQRCPNCGAHQFYPAVLLQEVSVRRARVGGREREGHDLLVSRSSTALRADPSSRTFPYTVALVDLDEGCRMLSNIVDVNPEDVRVGMPVEVVFEEITPEISLPKFRPRRQS